MGVAVVAGLVIAFVAVGATMLLLIIIPDLLLQNLAFLSTNPPHCLQCQICSKLGHSATTCDQRYNNNNAFNDLQSSFARMQLTQPMDTNWYPDTRATHHMIGDSHNMSQKSEYGGSDQVMLGNGDFLPIKHTGTIILPTTSSSFHLSNVLHVPLMRKNLLSVARFTKDNSVSFTFFPRGFSINDLRSGSPLFQGRCEDGLFPIAPPVYRHAFSPSAVSPMLWHQRLGHPSSKLLSSLGKTQLLPSTASSFDFCFSSQHKGYHYLDCKLGRLYISRHVKFDEAWFPYDPSAATPSSALDHNEWCLLPVLPPTPPSPTLPHAQILHSSSTNPESSTLDGTVDSLTLPPVSPPPLDSTANCHIPTPGSSPTPIAATVEQLNQPPTPSPPAPSPPPLQHPMITCLQDGTRKTKTLRSFFATRFLRPLPNFQIPPPVHEFTSQATCLSNNSTSDEADEHQLSIIDERKQRRMISNRESARRSRMRKQKHLDELWSQVVRLRNENQQLIDKLNYISDQQHQVLQENAQLKKEASELRQILTNLEFDNPYTALRELDEVPCITAHLRAESSNQFITSSMDLLH
ncbi:hypothetical protein HHK36_029862 [Tetracentron sinense]|uniref:BZIP domain-containing protein n=1 Tax=Tetracentron sinense TaxID=13715 RepID=A0A834YFJ5_TETSI|nr:hypothetical protein HHK36_029862 [Tetracentron sinense]